MDEREELQALRRLAELEAKAAGTKAAPAEPPMDSTRPDNPEYPRRETSVKGLVTEALKGTGRGVTALPRLVSEALAAASGPRPATPGPAQRMLDRFYEQINPDPNASQAEQMVGTGAELSTSMIPFAGAGSAAVKAARVAVPTVGGVAGEQLAGEAGKIVGSLAAPLGMKSVAAVGNPGARTNANKQVARELIENRIPVLPSAADAGPIKRGLEGFGGKERVLDLFRQRAQPELQRLASEATGVPAGQLTRANLDEAARHARGQRLQNIRAVRQMLVDADSGVIDTRKAYNLKQQRAHLSPELDVIAKAGSPMFRPSTMPPVEGAGVPFKGLGDLGTYGRLGIHLFTGGASLTVPAARALARHQIASPAGQQALYRHLADHPGIFGGHALPNPGYAALGTLPLPLFSQGDE